MEIYRTRIGAIVVMLVLILGGCAIEGLLVTDDEVKLDRLEIENNTSGEIENA